MRCRRTEHKPRTARRARLKTGANKPESYRVLGEPSFSPYRSWAWSRRFAHLPPRLVIALPVICYYDSAVVDDRWYRDGGIRGKSEHMKAACRAKARAAEGESRG
jgi:hypothetical protein